MAVLRFGPGGLPMATKGKGVLEGIAYLHRIGLDATELEFVRHVYLKKETALAVNKVAKENNVSLSAHAPYFINLVSEKKEVVEASKKRILDSARALHHAGGHYVAFHAGYYGKMDKEEAFKQMKKQFQELVEAISKEKLGVKLAPETTGGLKEWGSLQEIVRMMQELGEKNLWMTIDWSHLHCRNGKPEINSKQDYAKIFDFLEKELGKRFVEDLHCHHQSVRWGQGGEIAHLPIKEKQPDFKPFAELCKENDYGGTIICESPLLEQDSLVQKKLYEQAK